MKSGYLYFVAGGNAVNNSYIYELNLNLSHSFHIDLSPLSWYFTYAECDNFKLTMNSPEGQNVLCGDKSKLNMQIIKSSVTSLVFQLNSLKELYLPFLGKFACFCNQLIGLYFMWLCWFAFQTQTILECSCISMKWNAPFSMKSFYVTICTG